MIDAIVIISFGLVMIFVGGIIGFGMGIQFKLKER